MKTIKVWVKRKHIKKGDECDPSSCPVALAIREHKGLKKASTCGQYVYAKNKLVATLNYKVSKWIMRFDCGDKVEPIKFKLEVTL